MVYPEKFEEKLDIDKIRLHLKSYCSGAQAVDLVDAMDFSADFDEISRRLGRTVEMADIMTNDDAFPTGEVPDLRDSLARIRVEGLYLEENELSSLASALNLAKQTVRYFDSAPEGKYPLLKELSDGVSVFPVLIDRIAAMLDRHGRIKDNASADLAAIRREIAAKQSAVSKRLASILKQVRDAGIAESDATISVRDGRSVIPVPAGNKRRVNGIVLDESASGRTVYIEPAEVVALNNDLRELGYAERREIIKILKEMSANIRPYADDILVSFDFLAHIDFIRAKVRFSATIDAIVPLVENRQGMYWLQARHPLLFLQLKSQSKSIVPLDIELEAPQQRILVISGPNAGGKSVCLKTVGIIQYMLQCGLPVPVAEGSKMGIFDSIFIDLGDGQSIENDLSTYSSHLSAMKHFVRYSTPKTLFLVDEFGTGTEPMLGGAIAESVLAEVNRLGAFGVVTTHYTNLKHFAAQTDGISNGAMLFDTHAIQPLFRLQIGQPGSSFAFEIARKIGLPENILADARDKIGQEHIDFDKHLREIIRDKRYWEQKRQSVKENEKRLADILAQYDNDLKNVRRERREILEKARRESAEMLAEANKLIEKTIKEIRESQAEKQRTKDARNELEEFKREKLSDEKSIDDEAIERKIRKIQERERRKQRGRQGQPQQQTEQPAPPPDEPIAVGDTVCIDGNTDHMGEVLQLNNKEAVVAVGNLSTTLKISRLTKISNNAARRMKRVQVNVVASNIGDKVREKKLNFKPELDVRGLRADEALERVAEFVDEAIVCEQSRISILHGKGTGILREQIRQYLNSLSFVTSVRDEHVQFGGAGITVVELE